MRNPDSTHVQTLKNQIRLLEEEIRFYRGRVTSPFADDLQELHSLLSDLAAWAVPGQGKLLDTEGRGSGDSLSADAKSTSEGRSTLRDRKAVEWAQRRIRQLSEDIKQRMDPNSNREDPRPRCGKRDCDGRGRRQPVGVAWCGFCGHEMA